MNSIELRCTKVEIREDGIMHIHIKEAADMELEDALEVVEAMGELGKGKKIPVLIDSGAFINIDKEVKVFSASKIGNIYTLADAIACNSFAQKLIARFYQNNNNPAVPTKIFTAEKESVDWLKTFIKEKNHA
jgi:acyl-CoA synthetase (NDP forming)